MSHALLQAWTKTLRRHGRRRAVVEAANGESCTFDELEARAQAWLTRHASAPRRLAGCAVVFAAPNGIGWLEIFLALMHAGAVAVPLDAAEPATTQRRMAEALRAGFWWDGAQLVPLPRARRFRDANICFIKLTSGTTGAPRPLVFTAVQLLADERQVCGTMGLRASDLNYASIPLGHSYGLGNLTLPLVVRGVPLVVGAAPLPHAIAVDFAHWRPTVFPSVPAVWRALAAADVAAEALQSLRRAISAGAPLPPEVARDFAARFGRRVHGFYGSSETGGIAYDRSGDATLAGSVGTALRGVRLTLARGERLRVRSAAVFTQGNRRPGEWTPPDRVTRDARGRLVLLGRRGSTVKIAGRRVNLVEIATRLRQLGGVRDAWVTASGGPEPMLAAAVASERDAAELRAALQVDTPPWKIPKRWRVMPEFPLTARGKTDTAALHAQLLGPRD